MSLNLVRYMGGGIGLAAFCVVFSGCAQPPTQQDLAASIMVAADNDPATTITGSEASCMAVIILDAGLSDTTLRGLAENFAKPTVAESDQDRVEPLVTRAVVECSE